MNYFTFKVKKKYVTAAMLLLVLAAMVGAAWVGGNLMAQGLERVWDNKDLAADILIAEYAQVRAGERVPLEADYSHDTTTPLWTIETNSTWLLDYTDRIVPFLVFDKISVGEGNFPFMVAFFSYSGIDAYTVNGTTYTIWLWGAFPLEVVVVNERDVIDPFKMDARETLITLVHELIHVQGGNFDFPAEFYTSEPTIEQIKEASARLEANTSAATLEALAGMCNLGDELACKAFWLDLHMTARNDLRTRLFVMGKDDLYQKIAAFLWMDKAEEAEMYKYARFWADHSEERAAILTKYNMKPWRETIIPGIVQGKYLNTGLWAETGNSGGIVRSVVQGMPFDDARYILPWYIQYFMRYIAW